MLIVWRHHIHVFINKLWHENVQTNTWPVVHSAWVVIGYLWIPLNVVDERFSCCVYYICHTTTNESGR